MAIPEGHGSRMKILVRLLIVLSVLGAGGYAAWSYFAPEEEAPPPVTVPVTRGAVERTVLASGALLASSVVSVAAEVSGRVETLHIGLGDTVVPGQTLVEIDSLNQQNAVKVAEAALANLVAQRRSRVAEVSKAETALARAEQLGAQNLVSLADLEAARATLEIAEAQVEALDAQLSQAELSVESALLDLSRTRIVAPAGGVVVAVLTGPGQTISATQGAQIVLKIADLDTMLIKAQISEADIVRVESGQKVYFTILGEPGRRYEATLRAVEPAPEGIETSDSGLSSSDSAVYYNGLFEVANPGHRLRIGMTTQVTIVVEAAEDALLVPAGALSGPGPGGRYQVAVYDPGTGAIEPRAVEIGLNNNIFAEVRSGLSEGERIVSAPGAVGMIRAAAGGAQPPGGAGLLGGGAAGAFRPVGAR